MSYEKVKNITYSKRGVIKINSACNNVRPLIFSTWEYNPKEAETVRGKIACLFRDIMEGNLQLYRSCPNRKIFEISQRCDFFLHVAGGEYDLLSLDFKYKTNLLNEVSNKIIYEYAVPAFFDEEVDTAKLLKELQDFCENIKNVIAKKEKEYADAKVILVTSAAICSCFKGYNILADYAGQYYLAPNANYENGRGVLHNDKEDAILLGSKNIFWTALTSSKKIEENKLICWFGESELNALREKIAYLSQTMLPAWTY